jgi:hypothetical protein
VPSIGFAANNAGVRVVASPVRDLRWVLAINRSFDPEACAHPIAPTPETPVAACAAAAGRSVLLLA